MFNGNGGNYLKLIIGPMFSSKSSSLLAEINRYKYITENILVVNSILDSQRHSEMLKKGAIKTHNSNTFPAIMLNKLEELKTNSDYHKAELIIIDEAQFYSDLYPFLDTELRKGNNSNPKTFIVAGLSSDYKMKPIGDIIKLVPLANEIVKLSAICVYCKDGTPASFNKLISIKEVDQIAVGAENMYAPCCRKHFY